MIILLYRDWLSPSVQLILLARMNLPFLTVLPPPTLQIRQDNSAQNVNEKQGNAKYFENDLDMPQISN